MFISLKCGKLTYKLLKLKAKTQLRAFHDVKYNDITEISPSAIKTRFKRENLKFEEGYTNFLIGCPLCDKQNASLVAKVKVFVNKKTGHFTCESCLHTGSWLQMQMYLTSYSERIEGKSCSRGKDPVIVNELKKLTTYVKQMKANTIEFTNISDDLYLKLLAKFNLPLHLPKNLFVTLGIRLDITQSMLFFPLYNSGLAIVGYKRLKAQETKTKHTIEPPLAHTSSSGVLWHKGSRSSSSSAIIVASEADFLSLVHAQLSHNVICLPNGLQKLSVHILPCFERFTRLILWLGTDLTAWDAARHFAVKLGERRCYFLRLNAKLPSIAPNQDFKSVLAEAQPMWHKAITTFSSLRQDVLFDLQNIERIEGVKWKRFPALNRILRGHRRGELTVFTGPTGSGKTTFISEYSLDLAMQGVNTLWGSFEIRNARLARTMLQQMAGLPLDKNLERFDHLADKFEELPMYYMIFHGQQSIKIVMDAIEHAVYVHDISHVIIDNLQFMMGMSEDARHMDRFWKQDLIVANFRTFATRRNCHVTLVIHPRKEREAEDLTMSSIFGGAKASQEADNILIIQDTRLSSMKGKKYLQICKNRYCGDLGVMALDFDKDSLSFMRREKKRTESKEQPAKIDNN